MYRTNLTYFTKRIATPLNPKRRRRATHGVYIQAAINTAKRYDNIILETSGMPMHTKIKEAVQKVGEERVVYGSDIPFHHTSVELQRVKMAGLNERELKLLLHDNTESQLI